jgi:hypothetical protein
MYYRVAIQVDTQPSWKWQSTTLSSLGTLLQWLQVYRAFPQERLRIFSASSPQELNEQFARENQGLFSSGVPALQFLHERRIAPQGAVREASIWVARAHERTTSIPAKPSPSADESGMCPLDKRREELEHGAGGDHDLPYQFTLPTSLPQALVWVKLLARVELREFQLELEPVGATTGAQAREWALPISLDAQRQETGTCEKRSEETEQKGEKIV